jgi:hypothetical protein
MKRKEKPIRRKPGVRYGSYAMLWLLLLYSTATYGQADQKIAVLTIDTRDIGYHPEEMGDLIRLKLEQTRRYEVVDKYDMADILTRENLDYSRCFGKTCLVNAGRILRADKMLSGSVELIGEKIVFSLRLIDVKSETIEKYDITEYLNLQEELQIMAEISVNNILGIENNQSIVNVLVDVEEPITTKYSSVQLNGPRMGVAYVTGDLAKGIQAPREEGGYDGYPVLSQFGYQYEIQYLSAGQFNALVEFLGMVSGLEQQLFIPSVVFMNGFRFGKRHWEFAFGPSISLRKEALGFYDTENLMGEGHDKWFLEDEWNQRFSDSQNPYPVVERMDSRGDIGVKSRWIWAVGRTFHSGHLNIPINVYVSPQKKGWYIGASVGFNLTRKQKSHE